MKILIINLSGIGNTVAILPLINKTKRVLSPERLDVMLMEDRGCEPVLEKNPNIDNLIIYPKLKRGKFQKIKQLIQQANKNIKYDIVLTTYPNQQFLSAILMRLLGRKAVQHKYSFISCNTSLLLSDSVDIVYDNFVINNLNLIKAENTETDLKLSLYLTKEELKSADRYATETGEKIGIHPGSQADMMYKRWDDKKWLSLIEKLLNNNKSVSIYVFCGPNENAESFINFHERVKVVSGIELRITTAVISKMDFFISNDSGLGHLAAAAGVQQAVLFAATDYVYSKPYSENCRVITPEDYRPFYVPHLGIIGEINHSINEISADVVFESVKKMML